MRLRYPPSFVRTPVTPLPADFGAGSWQALRLADHEDYLVGDQRCNDRPHEHHRADCAGILR